MHEYSEEMNKISIIKWVSVKLSYDDISQKRLRLLPGRNLLTGKWPGRTLGHWKWSTFLPEWWLCKCTQI